MTLERMLIMLFLFLMSRPPPRSTRTYTLFPCTTLFRSVSIRENMHAARSLVEPIPYGQWTLQQAWRCRSSCARPSNRPYGERESGGRSTRQPGQVLTEAATTNSLRGVPAPTFLSSEERRGGKELVSTVRYRG